jgi:hypothetical protein
MMGTVIAFGEGLFGPARTTQAAVVAVLARPLACTQPSARSKNTYVKVSASSSRLVIRCDSKARLCPPRLENADKGTMQMPDVQGSWRFILFIDEARCWEVELWWCKPLRATMCAEHLGCTVYNGSFQLC